MQQSDRMTISAAARAVGCAKSTVSRRVADGSLAIDDDGLISLREVRALVRNRIARAGPPPRQPARHTGETFSEARTRKEVALANIRELEAGKLAATLLPADEVVAGWQDALARARSLLLRLPFAAAPAVRAAAPSGDAAIAVILRRHIEAALTELATTGLADDDDDAAPG